jgi:hypothetical protein
VIDPEASLAPDAMRAGLVGEGSLADPAPRGPAILVVTGSNERG